MNKLLVRLPAFAIFFLFLFIASEGWGCNVPVFRYSLERWERDAYRLMVVAPGELDSSLQQRADHLSLQTYYEDGFCNFSVEWIDNTDASNVELLETYPAMMQVAEPTAFLLYPADTDQQRIIFHKPFSDEVVDQLVASDFVDTVMHDLLSCIYHIIFEYGEAYPPSFSGQRKPIYTRSAYSYRQKRVR